MDFTGGDPKARSYLYEYVFHQGIEAARTRAQENSGKSIRVSEAIMIRNEVGQKLGIAAGEFPRDLPVQPFVKAVDDAITEHMNVHEKAPSDLRPLMADGSLYNQSSARFMAITGADGSNGNQHALPISPYDPRHRVRGSMMEAGKNLRYIRDVDIVQALDNKMGNLETTVDNTIDFYDEEGRQAGQLVGLDDITGLSRLRRYMSDSEYSLAKGTVARLRSDDGVFRASNFMSPAAMDRAEAILSELQSQGAQYSIERDTEPGQISARIAGSNLSVRLTDTSENEHLVGRTYDRRLGVYTVFHSTEKQGDSRKYAPYTNISAQEAVDLMRFSQGLDVQRPDTGTLVGSQKHDRVPNTKKVRHQSYTTSKGGSMSLYKTLNGGKDRLFIHRRPISEANRVTRLANAEQAESFLRHHVDSARDAYEQRLNLDALIDTAAREINGIEGEEFDYSPVEKIAAIQRSYYDVLTGKSRTLVVAGQEDLDIPQVYSSDELLGGTGAEFDAAQAVVRAHAADLINLEIGTFDARVDDQGNRVRFNPAMVASYMSTGYGQYRNNDDVVRAVRQLGLEPDELIGDDFDNLVLRDKMINFDASTARLIDENSSEFMQSMGQAVRHSLMTSGVERIQIAVDDQGVIAWRGVRTVGEVADAYKNISGEIGQVFEPGDYGAVTTKFAAAENYLFAPGYNAVVIPQAAGESKSVEERTRLHGYEQMMRDKIASTIKSDLLQKDSEGYTFGEPTALNGVYRSLADVRHPVDFLDRSAEEGLGPDLQVAILATEASRVRYSNGLRVDATVNAAYRAENGNGLDADNDTIFDNFRLVDGRNMSIITQQSSGYYDLDATSTGTIQGIVRYLAESATVDEQGRIIKGLEGDGCALMNHHLMRYQSFNTPDRRVMTFNNTLNASQVSEPVGTVQMTFGGWNMDDGIIVSQEFADRYQVRGANGSMRALKIGDKLSDLNGNKGVISLVVDRDMSEMMAEQEGISEAVAWFKANPSMDVAMAPFSAVSRFNGGSYRELSENPVDLVDPVTGEVRQGKPLGQCQFIVTHLDVEKKTSIYDAEAVAEGKGRKASSQLVWGLNAAGANQVAASFFDHNTGAVTKLREELIVLGMDMDEFGNFVPSYQAQEGEQRQVIDLPEAQYRRNDAGDPISLNTRAMLREFSDSIENQGGVMALPFELKLANGQKTEALSEGRYGLPLMAASLRSGRENVDGSMISHDYTRKYEEIANAAIRYQAAQKMVDTGAKVNGTRLTESDLQEAREDMSKFMRKAQSAYDDISNQIINRDLSGKHNIFKEGIMSKRQPKSATAVWTADPRLGIDEVAVSPAIAQTLGIEGENGYAMVWRDPVLRDSGIRYMNVRVDENLTGCAIHPAMAGPFDGDFDGDTVALLALDPSVHQEAMMKLSVQSNLVDQGSVDAHGLHPLNMNNTLDAKVSAAMRPALNEKWEDLSLRANRAFIAHQSGEMGDGRSWLENCRIVKELNEFYSEVVGAQYGDSVISYEGINSHLDSLKRDVVDTGAKGNDKKLEMYAHQLGAERGPDGQWVDTGVSKMTVAEGEGVQLATAIKSHGTGIGGKFSQRGMMALRNACPKAVLELTYPATQAILQAKHDPVEAKIKYESLMSTARDLWKGYAMESFKKDDGGTGFRRLKDEQGKFYQATTQQWVNQLDEIYTSKDALNLPDYNPAYAREVATALTGKDGRIMNLEDPSNNLGVPMDQLAYSTNSGREMVKQIQELANHKANLFEGEMNQVFAPKVIRRNMSVVQTPEAEVKGFMGREMKVEPKVSNQRSAMAKGVGGERIIDSAPIPVDKKSEPVEVVQVSTPASPTIHPLFAAAMEQKVESTPATTAWAKSDSWVATNPKPKVDPWSMDR